MAEFIIEHVTDEELRILDNNGIDWYPDTIDGDDIFIEDRKEAERAFKLLNRKEGLVSDC